MKRKSSTARPTRSREDIAHLEDIPNIGPAVAADLRQLGITTPGDLLGRDPYAMYDDLCRLTGQSHDPCLLDTFISAVRFMEGVLKKSWWKFTAERKNGRDVLPRRTEPRLHLGSMMAGVQDSPPEDQYPFPL